MRIELTTLIAFALALGACSHTHQLKRFRAGCESGDAADCVGAAEKESIVREPDWEQRYADSLIRACELGEKKGCTLGAEYLDAAPSDERDLELIASLYERGCLPYTACSRATTLRQLIERNATEVPAPKQAGGGLDKEVIKRVITAHSDEVKYCYEAVLREDPMLTGKVEAIFLIGPSGNVWEAHLGEGTNMPARVGACVLHVVRDMVFPPPKLGGLVSVTFPWVFKAAGW